MAGYLETNRLDIAQWRRAAIPEQTSRTSEHSEGIYFYRLKEYAFEDTVTFQL